MPNPRYLKQKKRRGNYQFIQNELEFSEELTETNVDYQQMQPVPQPKDYDEIEY